MVENLFGKLPDGWKLASLGEVCAEGLGGIQTGPFGSQLHAHDYVAEGIPTVMPTNIGDNRIVEDGIARISPSDVERLSRHKLAFGDIVYSRRGDVEKRALVRREEEGWLCGTGCLRVRVDPSYIDPSFMSYVLGHPRVRAWITQHAVGATMPNLNSAILADVPVVIPPHSTQRTVADLLTALDDKIESNRRATEGSERILSLMSEVDIEPVVVPLADLVSVDRDPVDPSRLRGAVDHYSIPAFDSKRWPDRCLASSIKSSKLLVQAPSVLLSRLNPGTPRLWYAVPESHLVAVASTEFLVLRSRDGVALGDLWLACSDPLFIQAMARRATGTSGSHQRIRPDDALSLEVVDPRSIPDEIRQEASGLLQIVHHRRRESRSLAALRDALLPELLSGRLHVPEAEDLVSDVV